MKIKYTIKSWIGYDLPVELLNSKILEIWDLRRQKTHAECNFIGDRKIIEVQTILGHLHGLISGTVDLWIKLTSIKINM